MREPKDLERASPEVVETPRPESAEETGAAGALPPEVDYWPALEELPQEALETGAWDSRDLAKAENTAISESNEQPLKGVVFLVAGLFVFSLQDVIVKFLSGELAVLQIIFIRGLFAMPILLVILKWQGGFHLLKTGHYGLMGLRALLVGLSFTLYYMALATLSLADTLSLYYACPIFVTALAGPLLGEEIGWRRWSAVLVGFAGVVVIVKPDGALEPAMLLAIAAAFTYASAIILTRKLSPYAASGALAVYAMAGNLTLGALAGLAFGGGALAEVSSHPSLAFLLRAWPMPGWGDLGLVGLCGLIAGVGFYLLATAYHVAPVSVVTPFEYTSLPWGMLWGFAFFATLPGLNTLAGLALIVASGLYIVRRERIRRTRIVRGRNWRPRV